ncbi:hypothetical protein [Aeromicrobium phragmitis]|uniref:hypothetical protein n=1 Tax=Aeromicrobium phragmitis TaxID=2478914 RepID=UPI00244260F1|nr:hypothetical protein [Aeromicrobium phragmitis]
MTELKQLLPPAKVEFVEKQPSLEDIFLTLVGGGARETRGDALATPTDQKEETS